METNLSENATAATENDTTRSYLILGKTKGQNMKSEYIFPTALIALDVLAAIPYAAKGNIRMAIYWLAAATLTACVTYTRGNA
jgi:hypothetical protein